MKARIVSIVSLVVFTSYLVTAQSPGDWPQWRGPNRDGISKETGLLKQWPQQGPPLVWKATGAAAGVRAEDEASGNSPQSRKRRGGERIADPADGQWIAWR